MKRSDAFVIGHPEQGAPIPCEIGAKPSIVGIPVASAAPHWLVFDFGVCRDYIRHPARYVCRRMGIGKHPCYYPGPMRIRWPGLPDAVLRSSVSYSRTDPPKSRTRPGGRRGFPVGSGEPSGRQIPTSANRAIITNLSQRTHSTRRPTLVRPHFGHLADSSRAACALARHAAQFKSRFRVCIQVLRHFLQSCSGSGPPTGMMRLRRRLSLLLVRSSAAF